MWVAGWEGKVNTAGIRSKIHFSLFAITNSWEKVNGLLRAMAKILWVVTCN